MKLSSKDVVFIRPASYPPPRVRKNMEVALELGMTVLFIGAKRTKGLPKNEMWAGVAVERLGIVYPSSSLKYLLGTPIFAVAVMIWLIRNRPEIIHASDVEGMLGVVLYTLLGGKSFKIFNIHDNFGLRYKVPKWFKTLLCKFEATIGKFADVVLVPDESRLKLLAPWKPDNFFIIPNTPKDPGHQTTTINEEVKIFASGWITEQRGYVQLGELVKLNENVELVICGRGSDKMIDYIRSLPRTSFYGYLPQEEALKIGSKCDLIFAFYDPSYEINIFASPNKVFDALALGRPVLINEETEIAKWVKANNVGYCIPYGSVRALNQLIDGIIENTEEYYKISRKARELYELEYRWDVIKENIKKIFEKTSGNYSS